MITISAAITVTKHANMMMMMMVVAVLIIITKQVSIIMITAIMIIDIVRKELYGCNLRLIVWLIWGNHRIIRSIAATRKVIAEAVTHYQQFVANPKFQSHQKRKC